MHASMWMLHFRPAILWSSAIHCSCQQSYGNQTYSCNLHWRVLTIIEDCLRLQRCHMFLKHVTVSCSICPVQHVSCCVIDLSWACCITDMSLHVTVFAFLETIFHQVPCSLLVQKFTLYPLNDLPSFLPWLERRFCNVAQPQLCSQNSLRVLLERDNL